MFTAEEAMNIRKNLYAILDGPPEQMKEKLSAMVDKVADKASTKREEERVAGVKRFEDAITSICANVRARCIHPERPFEVTEEKLPPSELAWRILRRAAGVGDDIQRVVQEWRHGQDLLDLAAVCILTFKYLHHTLTVEEWDNQHVGMSDICHRCGRLVPVGSVCTCKP